MLVFLLTALSVLCSDVQDDFGSPSTTFYEEGTEFSYRPSLGHHQRGRCWQIQQGFFAEGANGSKWFLDQGSYQANLAACNFLNTSSKFYQLTDSKKLESSLTTPNHNGHTLMSPSAFATLKLEIERKNIPVQPLLFSVWEMRSLLDLPVNVKNLTAQMATRHKSMSETNAFTCDHQLAFIDMTAPITEKRFYFVNFNTGNVARSRFLKSRDRINPRQCSVSDSNSKGSFFIDESTQCSDCIAVQAYENKTSKKRFIASSKKFQNDQLAMGRLPKSFSQFLLDHVSNDPCLTMIYFYPDRVALSNSKSYKHARCK